MTPLEKPKTTPVSLVSRRSGKKDNLVNSSTSTKSKEDYDRSPLLYLFDAYEFMTKDTSSVEGARLEFDNDSQGGKEELNSPSHKRFELSCSFTQKAEGNPENLQAGVSSPEMVSINTLCATKPKKFGDRPDVIYKTILRSFKKYYLNDFNEVTDYKKKKRRMAHQADLIEMADLYVKTKFSTSPYSDLSLFVAAIVQPKIPEGLAGNGRLKELSKTVCEVLYKFNKTKMNNLLLYPQFSYMLKKFLSIDDLIGFIGEKSTSPQATQNLEGQIEFLLEQCNRVLTSV